MAKYIYDVYEELPTADRYKHEIKHYAKGSVTAGSRKQALEKVILKVGMNFWGATMVIMTESGQTIYKMENTERPVEPWGRQWTDLSDKGMRYDSNVHNYHIHNGRVYYCLGTGMNAYALNPVKRK